jgi:hypothetical protein
VDPDVPRDGGGIGPPIAEDLTQRRLWEHGAPVSVVSAARVLKSEKGL